MCLDSHMALGLLLLQIVGPEGHPGTPGLRGRGAGFSLAGAAVLVSTVLRCPPAAPLLNFSPGKLAPPGSFGSADRSEAQVSQPKQGYAGWRTPIIPSLRETRPFKVPTLWGRGRDISISQAHSQPLQACLPSECHALSIPPPWIGSSPATPNLET